MTTLPQNFIRELVLRGMSPRTQESYVRWVYCLAQYYHKESSARDRTMYVGNSIVFIVGRY
jgi:hypothetical protein